MYRSLLSMEWYLCLHHSVPVRDRLSIVSFYRPCMVGKVCRYVWLWESETEREKEKEKDEEGIERIEGGGSVGHVRSLVVVVSFQLR